MIQISTFNFLNKLAENNNREWFTANRKEYETAKANFEDLCQELLDEIIKFQPEFINTKVKDCIFRINRDVRFSADKSPYKHNFAAAFGIGGKKSGQIDFYLHLEPHGETMLGGGMWQPTPQNLAKFRQEIDYNAIELKNIIQAENFREFFPEIHGKKLKNVPKGYPNDHPEIDLLRYQELFFAHRFTDNEVLSADFAQKIIEGCKLLKPYISFLNYLFYDEKEEFIDL